MIPQPLRISIVQAPLAWGDIKANLSYFSEKLKPLKGITDLIILPEMFATAFITNSDEISETMEGSVMKWLINTSAQTGCIITGTIAMMVGKDYFNRMIWMRPDGTYELYDKRHMFRMGNEHLHFTPGNKQVIVKLKGWKIMLQVCYDLRFPVWSRNNYSNDEYAYDLLIYVANWPASRNMAWNTLLSARAIENQVYCVGVNRVGEDGRGIPHVGGSVILDFKGKLITGCEDKKPDIVTHPIEFDSLQHFREQFKVALDWDKFTLTP